MSQSVGVIGLGNRLSGVLTTLNQRDEGVTVSCVADPDLVGARERLARSGMPCEGVRFYADADEMLEKERPDGLMIGTRCNLHAQRADKVLGRGTPLFLEKPVCMNEEGLALLLNAQKRQNAPVMVSFPLRVTHLGRIAKDIIDRGVLGPIAQVLGQTTVNYGRGYYKKWYRDGSITGGMFLQKATHDLDLIFYLTGANPVALCAMETRAVMGGDMPAGVTCDRCEKRRTCPESDWSLAHCSHEAAQPLNCSFGADVTIADAGSVLIQLDNGAHVCYGQCFVARKDANRRSTRIVGQFATLDLDFATDTVKVYHHDRPQVDTYTVTDKGSHSGGDDGLMERFAKLLRGEACDYPTLEDGVRSARTCLRAQQFAQQARFMDCTK